ncbi:MAG TPA: tetratricopeptide repeat protein [Thermoanaerobaculia bacterium]|nr:tetratricopeptide repeat protein [Thermoanaerobaculia bacterium]
MQHVTAEQLIDYAVEPERVVDRGVIEEHLRHCADCASLLADVRNIDAALAHPDLWKMADELADSAEGGSPAEDFATWMAAEDVEAAQLLAPMLAAPGEFVWANVSANPRFHTAGVARLLCKTAKSFCERKPLIARTLAEQAILIAESIRDETYPGGTVDELRGTAWKDLANALRFLGNYQEALDALDRADRAFRRVPASVLHQAIVQFVRATVLMKSERLDEAEPLARSSAATFASLGQSTRYIDATLLVAAVLAKRGEHKRARQLNLELLSHAEATNDPILEARVSSNLGYIALMSREFDDAMVRYQRAFLLYGELGATSELIRARWLLALVTLGRGMTEEGVTLLRRALDDFLREGMLMAAAMVALDLAKPLLAMGGARRRRDVTRMCARLTREFRAAGMLKSAMTAIAYFREALRDPTATPTAIEVTRQHVRRFLEQAEDQPHLHFHAPR